MFPPIRVGKELRPVPKFNKGAYTVPNPSLSRCIMAKKAKRRGRPPGSKNKSSGLAKVGKTVAKMDEGQLHSYIEGLQNVLAKKLREQKAYFEDQLFQLTGDVSKKTSPGRVPSRWAMAEPPNARTPSRNIEARKIKSVKWSGRGMMPIWMREEMKGTKLKKEDFAIK
jgi:DNA-binding protein H-NS